MSHDKFDVLCEEAIRVLTEYMPSADKLIKPTLLHCTRVGMYLLNNGYENEIVLAGFLHDMIEDTQYSEDQMQETFGAEVLRLVSANTKNTEIEKDQQIIELFERCAVEGKDALIVKAADVLDNYKYYVRMNFESSIEKMMVFADRLLKHTDALKINAPVFDELRNYHSKYTKISAKPKN